MNPQPWAPGEFPWLDGDLIAPGVRVIIDNDFAGDPDDLFQLVHHLMSPAVDVRGVVASHLAPGDPFDGGPETAADGAARLRELFNVMGFAGEELIWEGAETALVDRTTPRDSPGARKIVAEALRDDPRPLYLCVGGGLTETASAWLLEPRIAQRLTVIWIGGPEHPGTVAEPPGVGNPEYNLNIDLLAGQVLFNDSDLPLWQVPRNVYRQCLVSDIELRNRVQSRGELGRYLLEAIRAVWRQPGRTARGFAETYALGRFATGPAHRTAEHVRARSLLERSRRGPRATTRRSRPLRTPSRRPPHPGLSAPRCAPDVRGPLREA